MKALFSIILGAAMLLLQAPAQAQQRVYDQAELDALLAPVALYPDPLLSQVLMAATYPADVGEAAAWSRANPHLTGEAAVHAAQYEPWDPSVKSLLAFPDVLARMDESPQWMMDLGQAFLAQEPHVMDTIQALRRRAQASGYLRSNEHYSVQEQGPVIAVVPVQPHVVYVPYYSPYVVYGPWWQPAYRPVMWRSWRPAPIVVSANFFFGNVDWHHRHVRVVHRPAYVHVTHKHVVPGRWQHDHSRRRASVTPHVQQQQRHVTRRDANPRLQPERQSRPAVPQARIPESQRQPIVQSAPPNARPAERDRQARTPQPRRQVKEQPRSQPREMPRARAPDSQPRPVVRSAPINARPAERDRQVQAPRSRREARAGNGQARGFDQRGGKERGQHRQSREGRRGDRNR